MVLTAGSFLRSQGVSTLKAEGFPASKRARGSSTHPLGGSGAAKVNGGHAAGAPGSLDVAVGSLDVAVGGSVVA